MKIISWNINGLRAVIKKDFAGFIEKEKPDILCLQEIKISEATRNKEDINISGYNIIWNSADRPGYSGTAILIKENLEFEDLPGLPFDNEGRVQAVDIGAAYLVNVYFPNANHELSRLDFKIDFNDKLLAYFKKLEQSKPVIICGDFNVAHQEIDLARPKENEGSAGFTREERAWMSKFLEQGFVDTFRKMHPEKIQYSWWSYRANARVRNVGWRIDYFCVSEKFAKKINNAFILDKVMGSDHAPVGIEL
jgi:exodeoxyribonuclease-3